jgi:hypothetical protein
MLYRNFDEWRESKKRKRKEKKRKERLKLSTLAVKVKKGTISPNTINNY